MNRRSFLGSTLAVVSAMVTGGGQAIGEGVTGVTVPVGIRETIDLALRLHPDAKAVAVIKAY